MPVPTPEAGASPTGMPWADAPFVDWLNVAQQIHERINQARAQAGLRLLAWSSELAYLAMTHSNDMARNAYFGHDSATSKDINTRAREGGISCSNEFNGRLYTGFSDNLYYIHTWSSKTRVFMGTRANGEELYINHYDFRDPNSFAEITVREWLNSPSHGPNLLVPQGVRHGVGISIGREGRVQITQVQC